MEKIPKIVNILNEENHVILDIDLCFISRIPGCGVDIFRQIFSYSKVDDIFTEISQGTITLIGCSCISFDNSVNVLPKVIWVQIDRLKSLAANCP